MGEFDGLELKDITVDGVNLAEKHTDELIDTPPSDSLGNTETDDVINETPPEPTEELVDQIVDEPVDPPVDVPVDETVAQTEEEGDQVTPPSTEPVLDVDAVVNDRFEGKYKSLDELEERAIQLDEIMGDEFLKNAVEYYKQNKTLTPYLRAMSYDFEKMSDEEVLRLNYNDKNQDLEPKIREKMFQREVLSKYLVSEDAESDEVEMAQVLLKREANKQRTELLDQQKQFIEPQPPVSDSQTEQTQQSQAPDPKEVEAQTQNVASEITGLINEGKLAISVGKDDPFNVTDVDVRKIAEMAVDITKIGDFFIDKKGTVNWQNFAEAITFMMNPDQFKKDLLNYGKSIGKESIVEKDLKNSVNGGAGVNIAQSEGDDKTAMINAFLEQRQARR